MSWVLNYEDLAHCEWAESGGPSTGEEVLEGRVEWFGAYDMKLELSSGRSVVVFRHAVYRHAVLRKE